MEIDGRVWAMLCMIASVVVMAVTFPDMPVFAVPAFLVFIAGCVGLVAQRDTR